MTTSPGDRATRSQLQPAHSPPRTDKTVIVVMGVAGSGKTTVAAMLADRLGWSFAEADRFQPPENVTRLTAGLPLTDHEYESWLEAIRGWIDINPDDAVLACPALPHRYRDALHAAHARVRFVQLDGSLQLLSRRASSRSGHFMPASLLESQLANVEPIDAEEDGVVIDIDASPADVADRALRALQLA